MDMRLVEALENTVQVCVLTLERFETFLFTLLVRMADW